MILRLVKPSIIILSLSGILLLISLTHISADNLNLWIVAKILYALGAILFIFDK